MNWYKVVIAQSGVSSVITTNQQGRRFFTVYGNTYAIKDALKQMGFRWFQGRWSTAVDFITPEKKEQLRQLGVDVAPLDAPPPQQQQEQPSQQPQPTVQQPLSAVDNYLASMKRGVEQAIQEAEGATGSDKARAILGHVDKMIEQLAAQVDEAAAGQFVKEFLRFSSRFHNYSFGNQMLIFVQNPKATQVAGAKAWFSKFGREVVNWDKGIAIIAPRIFTTDEGKRLKSTMSPQQWQNVKDKYERVYFTAATVYDIADTKPVEGWKGKEGEGPYEPKSYRQESNDPVEEVSALMEAAMRWADSVGIDVATEEMGYDLGGWSEGGKVRINNAYDGINKFSTIVHELAHEVLHQTASAKSERREKQWTRKDLEIDAETTAYVVLSHYGYEAKDTPAYIALWRGKGEDVKNRRENIAKAVKTIIHGIDSMMASQPVAFDENAA